MPVAETKLHLPAPRRRLVARLRLTDRLLGASERGARLVLVAAPAGFGKTTLLAQWLAQSECTVAWLALDASDSDPHRFLRHLVAAVQVAVPDAGADAAFLLELADAPVDAVLVSLVNDLDTGAGPMVVGFDDYHVIDDPAVHDAVAFFLDNLPPHVTLAMSTRVDPPLGLSRLRARGELVEVRAADLRFTADEASDFLNGVMGLSLEPALVDALGSRTEGWAAGLQLAALSARDRSDASEVAAFVEDFSGSHRFVLDYLVEEVLDGQSDGVRDFLLRTSVVDQLTGELCNALTGREDGQLLLEQLERDNVFVVPLDDVRCWFRYHHLFADAMRARLASREPALVHELHGLASRWFGEHGLVRDAVAHALASGDHHHAADLVELGVADLRRQRDNRTIREWIAALPEEVVRRRPLLALYKGWSRLAEGDIAGVETWLAAAEFRLGDDMAPRGVAPEDAVRDRQLELRSVPAMIEVYRAAVSQARRDADATLAHATRALEHAAADDHFARGAAAGFVGMAAWASGDLAKAVDTFSEAVTSLGAAGMVADELGATVVLGNMWLARGRPDEARHLLERALDAAVRRTAAPLPTLGDLHVALADVLREQGDLAGADHHLQAAHQLGEHASLPENRHRWFTTAAALHRARGDFDGAVAMLDEAERLFLPGYFPDVRPIASLRARLWIAQDRLDAARSWIRTAGIGAAEPCTYLAQHGQLTLARLLIAEDAYEVAVDLLTRVLDAALATGRTEGAIEARALRALAHAGRGGLEAAAADLSDALAVGKPAGYRRLFLDEGERMVELLRPLAATGQPDARANASAVLAAVTPPEEIPEPAPSRASGVLVDPLSERELEVLRLLGTDLSGPEIAGHLFVSINTLRTHTKHIFTKLDVNTRRAAVRRAAELGVG